MTTTDPRDALASDAVEAAAKAAIDTMDDEDWADFEEKDRDEVRLFVRTAVVTYLAHWRANLEKG